MKTIIMFKTAELNEETAEQLSQEVNKTLATETNVNKNKIKFTAVDMWNRNRQSRSASTMMRKWDLN